MPTLAADQKLCKDLLPEVSRTFTLSIELLPESMREPVRVAYLLCRIVGHHRGRGGFADRPEARPLPGLRPMPHGRRAGAG